jgi:ribose transport system permease protein
MTIFRQTAAVMLLSYAPILLLYAVVVATFAALTPGFCTLQNLLNVLVQSSAVAVVAVGMTFVLLTAGIDLSVGSVMFLCGTIAGSLVVRAGWPVPAVLPAMLAVGLLCGLTTGLLITRLRMAPFVVTLAMLFVARGLGLWITETRAINLPETFLQLADARIAGVPSPILILALVLAAAQLILWQTPFGRQLYAVGNDPAVAKKAGVHVDRVLLWVYMVSGICAAIGSMITLAQLAAVSPNMGQGRELDVIAAAVLGGTSLFGGRGSAIGSVLGAVLVETVRNGLNLIDADPYIYPVITGAIILLAVLLDSGRHRWLARLRRHKIRTVASRRWGIEDAPPRDGRV